MKSKTKTLAFVASSLMAMGLLVGCGGNPTPTKYSVSCDSSNYYQVNGLSADGYEANTQVSFTIEEKLPDEQKVSVVTRGSSIVLTPDSSGNYTFNMPDHNETITVGLAQVDHYVLEYDASHLKVDDSITTVLKNNNAPVIDYILDGKTDDDKTFFRKASEDSHTLEFVKAGTFNLDVKVGGQVVKTQALTVAPSSVMTIHDAFEQAIKEAPCNGKAGNNSAKTTSSFTIGGKVVFVGENEATTGYQGEVIIDDGTDICVLEVYGSKPLDVCDWTLGDSVKVTCKFTNYYGVFEGIATSSNATKQESLYPDQIKKSDATYELSSVKPLTAALLKDTWDASVRDGAEGATTYHTVQFVEGDIMGAEIPVKEGAEIYQGYVLDGCSELDCKGRLCATPGIGSGMEAEPGVYSHVVGYLTGCNTNTKYNYGSLSVAREENVAVTEWEFDDASVLGFVGADVEVPYSIVAPLGATGRVITPTSSDLDVCEYDGRVVTGITAGDTTIKLDIDGVEHELPVTILDEAHPCTSIQIHSPIDRKAFIGEEVQMVADVECAVLPCTDQVVWSVSDKTVAEINNKGLVTIKAPGKVYVSATCGAYSDTCEIKVQGYGTLEEPISVSEALAIAEYECPENDQVTKQPIYCAGYVATQPKATTYIQQFKLGDLLTDEQVVVYSMNLNEDLPAPDQNDAIELFGYIKRYSGTIEFASSNGQNVEYNKNIRGASSVIKSESNAQITDLSKESGTNGDEFTFKVSVNDSCTLQSVKVGGVDVTADDQGVYKGVIHGDTVVSAIAKLEGAETLSSLTFPDANSENNKVGSYFKTWTAKDANGLEYTVNNFNNNNWNGWSVIKCGSKSDTSVATIVVTVPDRVASFTIKVSGMDADLVNSFALYSSIKGDFSDEVKVGDFDEIAGDVTVNLSSPSVAGTTFKIVVDCQKGSANGFVVFDKIEIVGIKNK